MSDGIHTYACLNSVILQFSQFLVALSSRVSTIQKGFEFELIIQTAALSSFPPRDPRSPRSIRDTTRQTLERSMQIASTAYSPEDWNMAISNGGPVVGDIVWKLANTLWRIFAQVRP